MKKLLVLLLGLLCYSMPLFVFVGCSGTQLLQCESIVIIVNIDENNLKLKQVGNEMICSIEDFCYVTNVVNEEKIMSLCDGILKLYNRNEDELKVCVQGNNIEVFVGNKFNYKIMGNVVFVPNL